MIEMRRRQLSFGDGLIAEEISDLCESWMIHADAVLTDEDIVTGVYEAFAKRHPKSRCRGRRGAPAEVVLRLLVLKHIRNWSYEVLEREVRANLVYRDFTPYGQKIETAENTGVPCSRASSRRLEIAMRWVARQIGDDGATTGASQCLSAWIGVYPNYDISRHFFHSSRFQLKNAFSAD